ncbi:MAG: PAS domain S-box protein [Candidatus Jordarchaeaceae archaeon]
MKIEVKHGGFQLLLPRILSRFIDTSKIDDAINDSLKDVAYRIGASCGYIFLLSRDKKSMVNTHNFYTRGVASQIAALKSISTEKFSWWMNKLCKGEIIYTKDISKLPEEARAEIELIGKQGIKSQLVLPLNLGGEVAGFIGFDNVEGIESWNDDVLTFFHIFSETIGKAIENKRMKEALWRYENIIRNISKRSFDGVYTTDPKGNLTFVSITLSRVLGYDVEEMIGKPIQNYLSESEIPKIVQAHYEVLMGKNIESIQSKLMRKDGSLVSVEISLSPLFQDRKAVEILGIFKDVTKQLGDSQINYQAELLQRFFNNMTDAIFILDTEIPPNIVECNETASAMLGYKKSEMLNKTMEFLYIKSKDFEEYKSSIISAIENDKPNFSINLLMKRKDGTIFPAGHRIVQLLDKDGKRIGWLSSINDLSKRATLKETHKVSKKKSLISRLLNEAISREAKALGGISDTSIVEELEMTKEKLKEYAEHLEELVEERTRELREAQEKLLKAERLAAIGELAAMVGHDLRNPLTGIAGATYILKKKLSMENDEKVKALLEAIEKSVSYSNKIVAELLEYSREIRLELTETQLNQVLKGTLDMAKIPGNIRLVDLTTDKPRIVVDVEKMQRVFLNIIQNAIDAMPEGGELTIKSWEENGDVEISFTDTGTGISKENMEKIFRPLFTTKSKGIGLGLPICKRIVEAHGGSISVKSVEGKGTTFTITLPTKPKNNRGEKT